MSSISLIRLTALDTQQGFASSLLGTRRRQCALAHGRAKGLGADSSRQSRSSAAVLNVILDFPTWKRQEFFPRALRLSCQIL